MDVRERVFFAAVWLVLGFVAGVLVHERWGQPPPLEIPSQPFPKQIRVEEGDTLWSLAQTWLGSGARWQELYDLNRAAIVDPDRLRPGTLLVLPSP
jgi:nucleoid-associated protein YgaU